jgi:hypothetical protein
MQEEEHEEEREEDEEEAARNNAFLHHLLAAMVTRQRTNDTNDEVRPLPTSTHNINLSTNNHLSFFVIIIYSSFFLGFDVDS